MRIGSLFTSHQSAPQRDSQNKEMQEYILYDMKVGSVLSPKTSEEFPKSASVLALWFIALRVLFNNTMCRLNA